MKSHDFATLKYLNLFALKWRPGISSLNLRAAFLGILKRECNALTIIIICRGGLGVQSTKRS